jgi:hypothetical protein
MGDGKILAVKRLRYIRAIIHFIVYGFTLEIYMVMLPVTAVPKVPNKQ